MTARQQADVDAVRTALAECRPDWWGPVKLGIRTAFQPALWGRPIDAVFDQNMKDHTGIDTTNGRKSIRVMWAREDMDSSAPLEYGFTRGDRNDLQVWQYLGSAAATLDVPKNEQEVTPVSQIILEEFYPDFRGSVAGLYYGSPQARRWGLYVALDTGYTPSLSHHAIGDWFKSEVVSHPDRYPSLQFHGKAPEKDFELALSNYLRWRVLSAELPLSEDLALRNAIKAFAAANDSTLLKTGKVALPDGTCVCSDLDDDALEVPKRRAWLAAHMTIDPAGKPVTSQWPPPVVDLSTPMKAARTYARTIESGDMKAFQKVTAGTPEDYKTWAVVVSRAHADRQLEDAAIARFGEAGQNFVGLASYALLDPDLVEKIDGDSATIGSRMDKGGIPFKRTAQGWKLDLTAMSAKSNDQPARLKMIELEERLSLGVAAMIRLGKFETVHDARRAHSEAMSLLMQSQPDAPEDKPADLPTTVPAPAPAPGIVRESFEHIPPVAEQRNAPASKRIVFLCSAGASMAEKLPTLRDQLASAIGGLRPDQQFNVIFFQDGKTIAFQKDALIAATPENVQRGKAFLEKLTARGSREAIPALTLAFAQKPELIYLMTDGDFPSNDALLKKVRDLDNPAQSGPPVTINTIAFITEKDTDTDFMTTLTEVAKSTGGTFKHVAANELRQ
jgi:hypothetical protein